jgi:hypothetical protein
MVLFVCAGFVVAGSLAILALAALGLEDSTIYKSVSAAMAVIMVLAVTPLYITAYKNTRESPEVAQPYVLVIATLSAIMMESLLAASVVRGGEPGFVFAAFSVALLYGLWVFVRLMTRPN